MSQLSIRVASCRDLPYLVQLLANDPLGKQREIFSNPPSKKYIRAFNEIDSDKNNYLIVVEDNHEIIGMLQLTIITHLTYQGGKRAQIEGVRIDEAYRGKALENI